MEPEKSKPIHNISMLGLKWRNQRVMRCAKVTTLTANHSQQQSLSAFNEQQQAYDRSQDFQKLMTDLKVSTNKLKVSSFEKARSTMPWNLRIEKAPYNLRHHVKPANSAIEIVEPRNKKREEEISERLKFFVSQSKGEAYQDFLAMVGSKPPKKPKLWPKSMHWLLDVSNNTVTTPTTEPSQQQSLFACNEQQQAYERPKGYQKLMTDLKVSSDKLKFPVFNEGKPTKTCNLRIEREPFNFKHRPKAANSVVGIMLSRNKKEGEEEEKINLRKKIIEKLKFSTSLSKDEVDQYFLAFFGSKPPIKPKLCPRSIHWKLDVSNNTMTTPTIDLSRQKYMFAFNKQQQSYDQAQGYPKLMTDLKVSTGKLKDSIFNKGKPTRPLNLRTEKAPWNCKRHTKPTNSISGIMVPANKKDEEEGKFIERLKYYISPKDEVEQDFLARVGNKPPKKSIN